MCGGCEDRETHGPMRLEDAISVTPYIRSVAEYVRGGWGAIVVMRVSQCVWKTLLSLKIHLYRRVCVVFLLYSRRKLNFL